MISILILTAAAAAAPDCPSLENAGSAGDCDPARRLKYAINEASRAVERLVTLPDVKAELTDRVGWESELTRIVLLRKAARWYKAKPEIRQQANRLLEDLIDRQPELLAPQALRYRDCGEARPHETAFAEQAACRERVALALVKHHPTNAFGHLLRAEGAWAEDNLPAAAEHLHRAGRATALDVGFRPGVQAVFATLDPLLVNRWDDAQPHRELGIYAAAGDLLDHRDQFLDTISILAQRCQTTTRDLMLSPCLALARALRLPGASIESVKLSLAVEGAVHQQRGNEALARKAGQLRVAAQQAFAADAFHPFMLKQVDPLAAVEALLKQGEAHARLGDEPALIDLLEKAAKEDLAQPLEPCGPRGSAPPGGENCLKSSTWWSESMVLGDFLVAQAQAPETLARWAADPDPGLQVLYAQHQRWQSGRPDDPVSLAALEQVVETHPDDWFPRRILMDRCIGAERWDCVEKAALTEAAADPGNGFPALQLAGLALKQGDLEKAREWIRLASRADRYDRGYGGIASGFYESYQKALLGPAVDPLNIRDAAILSMSMGIAAALSGIDAEINKACNDSPKLAWDDCLEAARIMQLPGGDFMAAMLGHALEERVHHARDDEVALARTLEKKAELRKLLESVDLVYVLQTQNVSDYVETLLKHGEIGAYRRYQHRSSGG